MGEVSVAARQHTHGYSSGTHGYGTWEPPPPGVLEYYGVLTVRHRAQPLRYFTPCASADLAPYADLVLYVSRDDGMLAGVRAKVLT